MKFQTIDQVRQHSTVLPNETLAWMSSSKKLTRWADCLEEQAAVKLRLLRGTEYVPAGVRTGLREDESALTLAFADPLLRAQGLAGDTYGDAHRFFGVSQRALHEIVCYCHYSTAAAAARDVAVRVREVARSVARVERFVGAIGMGGTRAERMLVLALV